MTEFKIDVVEARVRQPEQVLIVPTGADWDERSFGAYSNIYIEPTTRTLMLRPLPLTPAWQTTAMGNYARLRLSQTNRAAHSDWREYQRGFDGNYYQHSSTLPDNDPARLLQTLDSYPANTGWYISAWIYNYGGDRTERLECGWTTPGSGVSLRIWSDAQIDIYKATDYLATVSVSIPSSTRAGIEHTIQEQQIDLLLIPCRRRSLFILTSFGGTAVYEFDDLDIENPNNEIVPAGQFWLKIPHGTITCQFAPLRYVVSGSAYGQIQAFRYPPAIDTTITTTVYRDRTGTGTSDSIARLRFSDDSADFVPDGITDTARIRVDLTGDSWSTDFVYGASARARRELVETADASIEIGDRIRWFVGRSPESRNLTVTGRAWRELELSVPKFKEISNRSCSLKVDEKLVFTGRTLPVRWTDSAVELGETWEIECRDKWYMLERQQIRDYYPLDGLELSEAIRLLAHAAGLTDSELDLTDTEFVLPIVSGSARAEWAVLPEIGSSYADAIMRLWQNYAATWTLGFRPTIDGYKLIFQPPASPPIPVSSKLYLTIADAVADGVSASEAWRSVVRRHAEWQTIPPEANEIIITGWDPIRRVAFQRIYRDSDSQDPTLPPNDRPANWLGEPQVVGLVDYTITTDTAAERALDILKSRLTQPRRLLTIHCDMQTDTETGFPVWIDDVIEISGLGYWRVLEFEVEFAHETDEAQNYRRARYELERIENEIE